MAGTSQKFNNYLLFKKPMLVNENKDFNNFKKKFDIFNICSSKPIKITEILKTINKLQIKTKVTKKPLHKADVLKTYGDNRKVQNIVKKIKFTNYKIGVQNTVKWYKKNRHLF